MTYQKSLQYLTGLEKMGIHLGLTPVMRLLERLGHPQDRYASIVVAGTNGKGSISATTASVLTAAGFKCGLYTSPHLVDVRERIVIGSRMISQRAFASVVEAVVKKKIEPVTYFEFLTAAAFLYFARENVDIAVLEVGMGGRLDATNCVNPAVSVVSNIALEHSEYLGNTLRKIAWEKGGIVKGGGVCVTAARQKKVIDVLSGICKEKHASLYRIGKEIKAVFHKDGSFSYRGLNSRYPRLTASLPGRYQIRNTACAIACIELLRERGFPVDDSALMRGIKNVRWPGRMEIVGCRPTVLLDAAHNPAGVTALCEALKNGFSYRRLILVFGVFRDKNYTTMIKKLASLADEIFVTSCKTERVLALEDLMPVAQRFIKTVRAVAEPINALRQALATASADDLVCVTGSLYLIGDIKRDLPLLKTSHQLS